jgi:hypothetical protein
MSYVLRLLPSADCCRLPAAGLGDQASECYLISGNISKGDSVMKCNKTEAYNTQGYEVRCQEALSHNSVSRLSYPGVQGCTVR